MKHRFLIGFVWFCTIRFNRGVTRKREVSARTLSSFPSRSPSMFWIHSTARRQYSRSLMMYPGYSVVLIVLWLMMLAGTDAYEEGAPDTSCINMMPIHGASSQTSSPPYSITTGVSSYSPGQVINGKWYSSARSSQMPEVSLYLSQQT